MMAHSGGIHAYADQASLGWDANSRRVALVTRGRINIKLGLKNNTTSVVTLSNTVVFFG